MGRLTKVLKNTRLMIAVGFILIILILVVVGTLSEPQWSLMERVLSVLMVVVVWLMLLMYQRMQEEKHARSLEHSLSLQADQQIQGMRPEKRQELERFKHELNTAIEGIKKRGIRVEGKSRGGRAALYALPWYVMIGPPGSGKSTAIKNSGLNFPLGDKELHGIGGTRNCDWFLSDSAILLDTAGRFVVEDDDHEEWLTFLDTLKKHRRRAPINGVIIGCSMQDLLSATPEELEWQADNIRKRIDELMNRLGIRFPVYLVFTKCDLLDGFVDFFETLNREEREQIWGSTYTREQYESENPAGVFETELQALLNELQHKRLARLSDALKRENRRKVFMFPLQLADMKTKMAGLVAKIFQVNPYQKDKPICRGFYFTSGTQEGLPIDRAIEAIAREFGLPPVPAEYSGPTEIKQYFIKDLLTDVIIADRDFGGGETTGAARLKRQMGLATMVGSALLLVLFLVGLGFDYNKSEGEMASLRSAATGLQDTDWGQADTSLYFNKLGDLSTEIGALENSSGLGSIVGLGMSRRSTVLAPAYELYFKKASPFMREVLLRELGRRLRTAADRQADNSRDISNEYLKAYLLLGSEASLLRENQAYRDFLVFELGKLLNDSFAYYSTEAKQEVEFYLNTAVREGHVQNFSHQIGHYQKLVTDARAYLNKVPEDEVRRRYKSLKQRVTGVEPVSFAEGWLHSSYVISGVFTKKGWEIFKELMGQNVEDDDKELWVRGLTEEQATNGEQKTKELEPFLQREYFTEYAQQWWECLNGFQYEEFPSLSNAADRLKTLSDESDSPVLKVLKRVSEEASFNHTLPIPKFVGKKLTSQAQRLFNSENPVDVQFMELLGFYKNRDALNAMLSQFADVSSELEGLAEDQAGLKAKEAAVKMVGGGEATVSKALKDVTVGINKLRRKETKDVLTKLLLPPLKISGSLIFNASQSYLSAQWQSEVCDKFSTNLAGLYPFSSRSSSDAQLGALKSFFGAQGQMKLFFSKELQLFFLGDTPSQQNLKPWAGGQGMRFSSAALYAFNNADNITTALLSGGDVRVDFLIKIHRPTSMETIDKVCLMIGGKMVGHPEDGYKTENQPKWENCSWPGTNSASGVNIKIIDDKFGRDEVVYPADRNGKSIQGEWGWFRFLGEARARNQGGGEYDFTWNLSSKNGKPIELKCTVKANTDSNPFAPDFFNFSCPAQLTD